MRLPRCAHALVNSALQNDLKGLLAFLAATEGPIDLRVPRVTTRKGSRNTTRSGTPRSGAHDDVSRSPAWRSPGKRERGTMENLLSMPTHNRSADRQIVLTSSQTAATSRRTDSRCRARLLFRVPMVGLPLARGGTVDLHRRQPGDGHADGGQEPAPESRWRSSSLPSLMLSGSCSRFADAAGPAIGEVFPLIAFSSASCADGSKERPQEVVLQLGKSRCSPPSR